MKGATHAAILASAYRAKAQEAVDLARQAREQGRESAHAGYVAEAIHWRAACSSQEEVTEQ